MWIKMQLKQILFLILSLFVVKNVAVLKELVRKPRIIGGDEVDNKIFPWSVHIYMYDEAGDKFQCGGSLISDQFVLTAAHCVIGYELFVLIFGENKSKQVAVVKQNNAQAHPHYSNETYECDIGIIKLKQPVSLTEDDVDVVGLPAYSDARANYENRYAITSGWGRTTPQQYSESDQMKILIMQILNNAKCQEDYKTKICAEGDGLETICRGDSGGPLVLYDEQRGPILVGITSIVVQHCKDGLPAYFTRVSLFLHWIAYITKIQIEN